MSLATRCTACGTVFRVVRDQLRVSEGWVRCGRCQEVFNALDHLCDLEREAPPPWAPSTASAGLAPLSQPQQPIDMDPAPLRSASPDPDIDRLMREQEAAGPATQDDASTVPTQSLLDQSNSGFEDARFPSQWPASMIMSASESGEALVGPLEDAQEAVSAPAAEPPPEFLRRAEREQRWRRPWPRALLAVTSLLLVASLCGQVAYHFRDWIVALWPDTRSTMVALCAPLDCSIEPLHHIDGISVDSSGLTRVSGLDAYKLSVVLHNRAGVPLALPSVDLTLTDPAGQLVARRVLSPAELVASQNVLAPGAEESLQATLSSCDKQLIGYTVEVFYP